ncbi:hypothetical protein ACFPK5_15840 [Streptomyces beijiangensis]|uniref:hypothetical protein n=1 Tax=Streptomyces beijiangensis TaxID=163361 RepID=UPI00337C5729
MAGPGVRGGARHPRMGMTGEQFRVTAAELERAIQDPAWAYDFSEETLSAWPLYGPLYGPCTTAPVRPRENAPWRDDRRAMDPWLPDSADS